MQRNLMRNVTTLDEGTMACQSSTYALGVAAVYQDAESQERANRVCDRVIGLIGQECLVSASWRVCDLAQIDVFTGAVKAATRADVIIISIHEAAELPPALSAWIEAWLPRRHQREGALVALVGAGPVSEAGERTLSHLEVVARRGALTFFRSDGGPSG
jgi:hypothetical protein